MARPGVKVTQGGCHWIRRPVGIQAVSEGPLQPVDPAAPGLVPHRGVVMSECQ